MRFQSRSHYLAATLTLALAALALFPALSRAGSAEIVYGELGTAVNEPFEAVKKPNPSPKRHPGSAARQEHTVESTTEPANEPEGEPESGHRDKSGTVPPGEGGKRPPGGDGNRTPNGKAPKSDRSELEMGSSAKRPTPTATRTNAFQVDNNGGSSPILPILIAMALLAALSIGVAMYRERKGHPSASA